MTGRSSAATAPGVAWRPDPAAAETPGWPGSCGRPASRHSTALQARAAADPAWFWGAAADDIGGRLGARPREVLDLADGPAWARWWVGGSFDWSWAAIEPRAARDPDGVGGHVGGRGRHGPGAHECRTRGAIVRLAARQLAELGVGPGDRVGILLPMLPETVVAVLAVSRIGAIFTPIFSGYARPGHRARLRRLRGEAARSRPTASCAAARGSTSSPSPTRRSRRRRRVERVLVVPRAGEALEVPWTDGRDVWWGDATAESDEEPDRLGARSAGPRDAVHDHLHVGHDRPAEGRRPRPRRLPDQGRPGPRPHVRPDRARHAVLVHRPRLDDGPVGDRRDRCCWAPASSSTRAHRTSRGRTGCGSSSRATG